MKFSISIESMFVGKADYEKCLRQQQSIGDKSSVVRLGDDPKHCVFLNIKNENGEQIEYVSLDKDNTQKWLEFNDWNRTIKQIDPPFQRITLNDTIVSSERLKKVEQTLRDLQDEINCIRNND